MPKTHAWNVACAGSWHCGISWMASTDHCGICVEESTACSKHHLSFGAFLLRSHRLVIRPIHSEPFRFFYSLLVSFASIRFQRFIGIFAALAYLPHENGKKGKRTWRHLKIIIMNFVHVKKNVKLNCNTVLNGWALDYTQGAAIWFSSFYAIFHGFFCCRAHFRSNCVRYALCEGTGNACAFSASEFLFFFPLTKMNSIHLTVAHFVDWVDFMMRANVCSDEVSSGMRNV